MSEISQERQVELNKKFAKAETVGQVWNVVGKMTATELHAVRDALTLVQNIFGLTMHDKFILGTIESEIRERAIKTPAPNF